VVFVDLDAKPIAPTELRRFSQRFGATRLFDEQGRQYRDAGLGYLTMSDDAAFERLLRDQNLIRLPLVRAGERLSVGMAEAEWRDWLRAAPGQ
jgi:arsenate reductase-like glutaredoxin family protein